MTVTVLMLMWILWVGWVLRDVDFGGFAVLDA